MLKSSVAKMTCPMKQFFSYLGASLAAIAALASCNKEIEAPVEDLNGGVPFEICASAVDTKTAIDGFATRWEADDAINLFHAVAGSKNYTSDGKFTITSENLATNKFTGTLAAALEAGNYDWYALYPYSMDVTTPASTSSGYVTVGGTSQTQTGNNSTAHLCGESCPLYGVAKAVASDVAPSIVMNHLASIIEVNVTNNSPKALAVSSVSFTGTEDIVGTYYIDFTQNPAVYTSRGESYVSKTASLSVTGGEAIAAKSSATFYIAIKPFTATTGQTLKVSVNGYEKEIPLTKDVSFTAGKIKKINFNYVTQTTYIWDLSVNSTSEASAERIAWTNSVADMVCTQAKGGTAANNYYPGASGRTSTRFYKNSTLSIAPKTGKSLTYYVFEATTEGYATTLANSTWTNAVVVVDGTTVTVVAKDPSVAVSAVIGDTCGFTRVECHTDEAPVFAPIISATPTSISVPAAGDVYTINYSINFPVDGKSISAKSDQDWVNNFDYSTTGEISFIVDANTGDARTANITLSYEGAEDVIVRISQNATGAVSETEIEITGNFTSITDGLSLTYQGITITQLKGTGNDPNNSYATAKTLRVYVGNTLTFSSDKTITKIVLTHSNSNNGGSATTANVGTYSRGTTSSTWTGSSNEVVITNTKGTQDTKNIQIRPTKIVVTVLK